MAEGAHTYPHPAERVIAKLYKRWWEIPAKPDFEFEVPATAFLDNGREVILDTAFHEYIVCEGELYKAMRLSTQGNLYEWENTVYQKGDGYGMFNDKREARKENKIAEALRKVDLSGLTEAQVTQLAEDIVKLMEANKCAL